MRAVSLPKTTCFMNKNYRPFRAGPRPEFLGPAEELQV